MIYDIIDIEIYLYKEIPTNLIPWPGPHVIPVILILEDPALIAMQSSPVVKLCHYEKFKGFTKTFWCYVTCRCKVNYLLL